MGEGLTAILLRDPRMPQPPLCAELTQSRRVFVWYVGGLLDLEHYYVVTACYLYFFFFEFVCYVVCSFSYFPFLLAIAGQISMCFSVVVEHRVCMCVCVTQCPVHPYLCITLDIQSMLISLNTNGLRFYYVSHRFGNRNPEEFAVDAARHAKVFMDPSQHTAMLYVHSYKHILF